VFTARYALSPYIKQIRFVFKGLNREPRYVTEAGGQFHGQVALSPGIQGWVRVRARVEVMVKSKDSTLVGNFTVIIFCLARSLVTAIKHFWEMKTWP
jgi:hypothetical protein